MMDWNALLGAIHDTLREVTTVPPKGADRTQADNQAAFDRELAWARTVGFRSEMTDDEVWHAISVIPFFGGVQPPQAARIARSRFWISDYREIAQPGWLDSDRGQAYVAEAAGYKSTPLTEAGTVRAYYNRKDTKGPRIIETAQRLVEQQKLTGKSLIELLVPSRYHHFSSSDMHAVYRNFRNLLNYGPVIDYHAMMELGLPVVKPDRMLTRTTVRLGLIPEFISDKGTNYPLLSLTSDDALVLGADPFFVKALQSKMIEARDVTGKPMREIDWLFAKMGMTETLEEGREFVVCADKPKCKQCKAHTFCAYGQRLYPIKVTPPFQRSRPKNSKRAKPRPNKSLVVAAE